jgi:predicted DNA binding CopG/RHH family protein
MTTTTNQSWPLIEFVYKWAAIMTGFDVPEFANESEEADWWEAHEDELANALTKTVAADNQSSGSPANATDFAIHIRLEPEDIAKARVQAAKRGLPYQTFLKMIIHEALRNAEAKQPSTASPSNRS